MLVAYLSDREALVSRACVTGWRPSNANCLVTSVPRFVEPHSVQTISTNAPKPVLNVKTGETGTQTGSVMCTDRVVFDATGI